jgi:puromycin-sensitive aminopeptidase
MVYGLVAQEGDEGAHDTFRELARKAPLHEEKLRLLAALARFSRKDLLQRTLELTLSPEVRSQDTVLLVMAVAGNRHGRDLAWAFVKDRWPVFDERYGRGGFAIMRLVGIGGGFTRLEDREDVERFFRDHPVPAAARTVQQSLERIGLNVRWLERNRNELGVWLKGLELEG